MLDWNDFKNRVSTCELCPRLRRHCLKTAQEKRKSYAQEKYWGKPLPGFGDPNAKLLIIGLAPAAHGANRTGRIFTGDRSGDWLYRALYKAGFANQPQSTHAQDGLTLKGAYVSCIARCAPPQNKPTPKEIANCQGFLTEEWNALKNVKVVIALGQIALASSWRLISESESLPRPKFAHGACYDIFRGKLILSYHPSQQNTFTGRLTEPMFDSVFSKAREFCDSALTD